MKITRQKQCITQLIISCVTVEFKDGLLMAALQCEGKKIKITISSPGYYSPRVSNISDKETVPHKDSSWPTLILGTVRFQEFTVRAFISIICRQNHINNFAIVFTPFGNREN
jgi:hypothetical protein